MARIRSIKPEFWKSETIASLPFRDRLTFIGLWSYVDDNGVGIDSYKLISAELFGLEDDPREVRDNTRECLARLADARLITRYTLDGKRYIRITNWDEHQRIDRPNKPRYPLPTAEGVHPVDAAQAAEMDYGTSTAGEDSRNPRATLASVHRLEQWSSGAGEQGSRGTEETHSPAAPPAAAEPLWPEDPSADAPANDTPPKKKRQPTNKDPEADPEFMEFYGIWPNPQARPDAFAAYRKARAKKGVTHQLIMAATLRFIELERRAGTQQRYIPHPATWLNRERYNDQPPPAAATGTSGYQPYRNPDNDADYEGAL